MPYINVKASKTFTPEEKIELKKACGKAIECFRGKTESWLMVDISSNEDMYFRGEKGDCAFIEVKVFGNPSSAECEAFTAEITEVMKKHSIPAERLYVRYEGGTLWGWNGSDF